MVFNTVNSILVWYYSYFSYAKTSEFTGFFVLIFLEKIKAAFTWNPVQSVANVSVHWIGGKNTFFKNFCKRENQHNPLVTKVVAKVVTSFIDVYEVTITQVTIN